MSDRNPSCDERIAEHRDSRLTDFRQLAEIAAGSKPPREAIQDLDLDPDSSTLDEDAQERIYEYPLAVSAQRVYRIDLSTGGPADWLEIVCAVAMESEGQPTFYEAERIVYHFADWFDHAERTLEGDDFHEAERFAMSLIPELG